MIEEKSVKIPRDIHQELHIYALRRGEKFKHLVARILRDYLDSKK